MKLVFNEIDKNIYIADTYDHKFYGRNLRRRYLIYGRNLRP
jgi:hypothetical protein